MVDIPILEISSWQKIAFLEVLERSVDYCRRINSNGSFHIKKADQYDFYF
jgi:hypothetical protein